MKKNLFDFIFVFFSKTQEIPCEQFLRNILLHRFKYLLFNISLDYFETFPLFDFFHISYLSFS